MARPPCRRCAAATAVLALAALAACDDRARPDDQLSAPRPEVARLAAADEALVNVHLPTLDPTPMNEAEVRKALEAGARCDFRYTSAGRPVLAYRAGGNGEPLGGVVKLNGALVPLEPSAPAAAEPPVQVVALAAGPVRVVLRPKPAPTDRRGGMGRRDGDMIFEVGDKLRVGYRGYIDCPPEPVTPASSR